MHELAHFNFFGQLPKASIKSEDDSQTELNASAFIRCFYVSFFIRKLSEVSEFPSSCCLIYQYVLFGWLVASSLASWWLAFWTGWWLALWLVGG